MQAVGDSLTAAAQVADDPSLALNSPNVVPQSAPATDSVLPTTAVLKSSHDSLLGKENILANHAPLVTMQQIEQSGANAAFTPKKGHPEDITKQTNLPTDAPTDAKSPLHIHSIKEALGKSAKLVSSPRTTSAQQPPASPLHPPTTDQVDPASFTSPTRPPAGTPIPPPSVGKQELNEAAMALTWLAEACTNAPPPSPFQNDDYQPKTKATKPRKSTANNNRARSNSSSGLRGRRTASQRCTTVLREALQAELELSPRSASAPVVTPTVINASHGRVGIPKANPRPANGKDSNRANRIIRRSTGIPGEKRPKGYSMNSRVGRAMVAILAFIKENEPLYSSTTAPPGSKPTSGGVPERIIRNEYGNNPDTSKALRFLVAENKIIRRGAGGRREPFSYNIAPPMPNAVMNSGIMGLVVADEASPVSATQETAVVDAVAVPSNDDDGHHAVTATPRLATATANINGGLDESAAAAALAPSTGKWPQTVSRVAVETAAKRAQLQPRLSLGGASAVIHEESSGGLVPVGVKRPAPTTTPAVVVPAAKRLVTTPPSTATVTAVAPGSIKWPSQLPTSQRLTTSTTTTPLPGVVAATAIAGHPSMMMFARGAAATPAGAATFTPTTQAQAQAYVAQLQALQLLYQQQWANVAQKLHEQQQAQAQGQNTELQGQHHQVVATEELKGSS